MSIDYRHEPPSGYKARLVKTALTLTGLVKDLVENLGKDAFPTEPAPVLEILKEGHVIGTQKLDGRKVWFIAPNGGKAESVIVYLHGGAYVENILPLHWLLLHELAEHLHSLIVVPDYPLAPTAGWQETHAFLDKLHQRIQSEHGNLSMVYMGDSAGGGLALAHAMKLRDEGRVQPEKLILLSPWLDISMSNPDILPLESKDKMLDRQGLILAAEHYAKGTNLKHPLLSPLYGDFRNLGEISVFIGTNDLLLADCRKLKEKLREENIPLNYFEYPEMFHVWVAATKLKESRHAIAQIIGLIREK